MTLLEPFEQSNDKIWVTQRFEMDKTIGASERTAISAGLEMQSAVWKLWWFLCIGLPGASIRILCLTFIYTLGAQ